MLIANRNRALRLLLAGALMLIAGSALAFSSGPPDGYTNAPDENNCTACHSGTLNSGAGMLALDGLPEVYSPGETYDLTVTLSDPAAMRWGFELTVLDGTFTGTAGMITATDAGTQTSVDGDRTYLKHRSSGTAPGTLVSKSWPFQWTAPDEGTGEIVLFVAGNAANNNGSTSGDEIYASFFGSMEDSGVPVFDTPLAMTLHGAAPNPFNPITNIRFDLPRSSHVRVTVLTMDGRRVNTLADRAFGEGSHAVRWQGQDHTGRTMGSGTYLYVIEADGERQMGSMTLLK